MNNCRNCIGILRIGILCFLAVIDAYAVGADPSVTLLTTTLDLGSIEPDSADPPSSQFTLLIRSSSPWRLNVVRHPAVVPTGRSSPNASTLLDEMRVLIPSREFAILPAGVPVLLASGASTAQGGMILTFSVKTSATFDSIAGPRQEHLQFEINGKPAGTLPLSYSVAPATGLLPDLRPFELNWLDPSQPGPHAFEPRYYHVRSNVPWKLEAVLQNRLQAVNSLAALGEESLVLISGTDNALAFASGQPVMIASGHPTGKRGIRVEVRLALMLRDFEAEGNYKSDLEFKALPVTQR